MQILEKNSNMTKEQWSCENYNLWQWMWPCVNLDEGKPHLRGHTDLFLI